MQDICKHILFFADTQANAKKIKRACKPTHRLNRHEND